MKEAFDRVERPFMLGLRSSSQDMRRKFFAIYNKTLPPTLFDRLKFILCTQNWEHLAGTFWLKHALARLLHDTVFKLRFFGCDCFIDPLCRWYGCSP